MNSKIYSLVALLALTASAHAQDYNDTDDNTSTSSKPLTLRKGQKSIVAIGDGPQIRAFSCFSNGANCLLDYAAVANEYYKHFDKKVNVYSMPVPEQCEFYGRDVTKGLVRTQTTAMSNCFNALVEGVEGIELIPTFTEHVDEPIYSRTDHHWAPLGAYYAAQQFAWAAGVPFNDLSSYTEKVVHRFLGTMYQWSKIEQLKNYPEDFIYYVPKDVEYTTTYVEYSLDKARKYVVRSGEPHQGDFFWQYKDGSGIAYSTFMGGDCKFTNVKTSTHNGRKLLILKDSFGNALPGFLFYSFEEITVVDCRYNTVNLTKYVNENGVTDILFANCIGLAASPHILKNYRNYLVQ